VATTPTTCPVHGEPLRSTKVRVAYGLPASPGDEEADVRFPFAGEPPLGGCCVPPVAEVVTVQVCSRCLRERRQHARG
jgi:hypothetical protein